jgi:hypothetical protein
MGQLALQVKAFCTVMAQTLVCAFSQVGNTD